jgi:hypothetical protein
VGGSIPLIPPVSAPMLHMIAAGLQN